VTNKSIFKSFADLADSLSTLHFYLHLAGSNQDKNEVIFFALGRLKRNLFQRSYQVWTCKCSICRTNRDFTKNCRITLKHTEMELQANGKHKISEHQKFFVMKSQHYIKHLTRSKRIFFNINIKSC